MLSHKTIGDALGRLLAGVALLLLIALVAVLGFRWFDLEPAPMAGPPPSEFPPPRSEASNLPPQPVQELHTQAEVIQAPADDQPVATKRADKLGTITGQREPRIEGSPPFHARVGKALTLLRDRTPTGYQYALHLSFIREGRASEMVVNKMGLAMAQATNCGRPDAGATLGPEDRGAVVDAANLAHEGAHIALRLCGPNSHADGRVYAVDLVVRHDLEDAGFAAHESFSRKVIAAEGGR